MLDPGSVPLNSAQSCVMPYTKTNDGTTVVFTVEPEPVPGAASSIGKTLMFIGIPFALMMMCLGSVIGAMAILAIFFGSGALVGKRREKSAKARAYREPATFRVSNTEISKDRKVIAVKDIHRIIIRNHMLSALEGTETVVVGNANYMAGRSAAMEHNRALEEISYRVDVESGGTATTLAGGLTETAAFGLAKDIQAITGLDFYH